MDWPKHHPLISMIINLVLGLFNGYRHDLFYTGIFFLFVGIYYQILMDMRDKKLSEQ